MSTMDAAPPSSEVRRAVAIDFLFPDLSTCERCSGTGANIETALAASLRAGAPAGHGTRARRSARDRRPAARHPPAREGPRPRRRHVARAYRELEADGVVSTHGRHGTVVAGPPRRPAPPPELLDAARAYADRASRAGATVDDALTVVRVAFVAGTAT